MRTLTRRFAAAPLAAGSILLCSLVLAAAPACSAELAADAPQTYVVQPGDTLWSIAGHFLRDPWAWSEVYDANPEIGDPNLIYPGDVLELTMVDGRPRVRRSGGRGGGGSPPVVKLTPQVRTSPLAKAVPTIPVSVIGPFLTEPYVADSDAIDHAPYVVGFPDEHLIAGINDSIYVRKIRSSDQRDFHILRPGNELRDPDSNDLLGYEATFVGTASLERVGDPARLKVVRMEREVSIGDRVIPANEVGSQTNFLPKPAPVGSRGRIIAVLNGVSQVGRYDVVVLNRGKRDHVGVGDVFEIYLGGEKSRDDVRRGIARSDWLMEGPLSSEFWLGRDWERKGWRRDDPTSSDSTFPIRADWRRNKGEYVKPFERAGVLMVFRTFDRVSFAIVLRATSAIHVGDWIDPPPR